MQLTDFTNLTDEQIKAELALNSLNMQKAIDYQDFDELRNLYNKMVNLKAEQSKRAL